MNNDIVTTTISDNFDEMAKAMGLAGSPSTDVEKKSVNQLARLRLNHSPIMGSEEVNGKSVNIEKVAVVLLNWTYLMMPPIIKVTLRSERLCRGICISDSLRVMMIHLTSLSRLLWLTT